MPERHSGYIQWIFPGPQRLGYNFPMEKSRDGSGNTVWAETDPHTGRFSYLNRRVTRPSPHPLGELPGELNGGDDRIPAAALWPASDLTSEREMRTPYESSYAAEASAWNHVTVAWVLGFVATAGLFFALPFFEMITTAGNQLSELVTVDLSKPPPPAPPIERTPPPETETERDEPELKKEQPMLTLSQLELALDPGMGDATGGGDFSMDFQVHVMEELELIFELSEIDRIPQVIYRVAPVYPYELKNAGVSGSVSLMFICDTKGHVKNIKVRSSSHRAFLEPTIRALRGWRFEPGIKDGIPVNVRMVAPFQFNPANE